MFDKSGRVPAPGLDSAVKQSRTPTYHSGVPKGTIGAGVQNDEDQRVRVPVKGVGMKQTNVGYNADGRKAGTPSNAPPKGGGQRSNPPAGVPNPKGF